jgi:hypothetical protein
MEKKFTGRLSDTLVFKDTLKETGFHCAGVSTGGGGGGAWETPLKCRNKGPQTAAS